MRQIKFRAWDNEKKQWAKTFWGVSKDGEYVFKYRGSTRFIPAEKSHCAVMQSTGLLDKNGVEIYEGDVVKVTITYNYEDEPPHIVEVSTQLIKINLDPFQAYYENLGGLDEFHNLSYEVIGNIYENPELL